MFLCCVMPLGFGLIVFTVGQSQDANIENWFSKLEESDSIGGEMFQITIERSSLLCSMRCGFDPMCFAYAYTEEEFSCKIIRRNSSVGQNFSPNLTSVYLKACRETWTSPSSWAASDQPSIYRTFENENHCLELINGAILVPGQVSNAVKTNSSFQQWVSLGDLSRFTCFPKPWTCGPEGASLSVWVRIDECENYLGIVSSYSHSSNGFISQYQSARARYAVRVSDGYFHYNHDSFPTDWYHLAMIFHGPSDGQGISIFHDGILVKHDSTKAQKNYTQSSGTVIIGKRFTDRDQHYGSIMVDELTFWDRQLLPAEIQAIATA